MTKKEIIELYLADLNNLVPDSEAKKSRIIDLEDELEALRIHDIVGQSEQLKAFADYAQKRMWEDGDKDLSEFINEFLSI